jgi:hypothetical protein
LRGLRGSGTLRLQAGCRDVKVLDTMVRRLAAAGEASRTALCREPLVYAWALLR